MSQSAEKHLKSTTCSHRFQAVIDAQREKISLVDNVVNAVEHLAIS